MSKIAPTLLNDTLRLVQLARETALVQGKQAQAERLSPVVKDLRNLVTTSRAPQAGKPPAVGKPAAAAGPAQTAGSSPANPAPGGILAQNDFRALLEAAKKAPETGQAGRSLNSTERQQMVRAMAAGNMADVDIARQMGMTREEVRMVLSIGRRAAPPAEVNG